MRAQLAANAPHVDYDVLPPFLAQLAALPSHLHLVTSLCIKVRTAPTLCALRGGGGGGGGGGSGHVGRASHAGRLPPHAEPSRCRASQHQSCLLGSSCCRASCPARARQGADLHSLLPPEIALCLPNLKAYELSGCALEQPLAPVTQPPARLESLTLHNTLVGATVTAQVRSEESAGPGRGGRAGVAEGLLV